ncbi:MAG: lysylphosphatidylglycerol synthase transmembrane domain-containing protein [Flavobacteriaceae bacterium]|nr:lysylphosphatidylglycerol synthase transmembrane domain-containing protein [Flavobacteriaceae bacterium]
MRKNYKKIILTFLPIILGVFLIWFPLSKLSSSDFETIKNAFKTANYYWILLSLLLGFISHASRAYRWKFLLEPLGYKPRFFNSLLAVFAGYLVNLGIPRAGEFTRAASISKYENIPFEKAVGTIVAERIADVFMLMLVIFIALLYQFELIWNLIQQRIPNNPVQLGLYFIALLFLLLLIYIFLKKFNSALFYKIKIIVKGLIEGGLSILKMKNKGAFIFHTLLIWSLYILTFYIASFALPETSNLSIGAILTGFIVGSLSIAATNGGIGTYPLGVQQALIIYGISSLPALTFGWIIWTAQTLGIILFGGISFLLLPIYNNKK